jgi:undecaprenyl-diphosphatase
MNEYLQLIILGIVQGIGEFLPISSDGHLVICKTLLTRFGNAAELSGKTVEVLLHIGTLASILVVYARELPEVLRSARLCQAIIIATIPAVIVGLTLEDWFDQAFSSVKMAGFGLLITASLLLIGQFSERARYTEYTLPWLSVIHIGCFQALALLPGVSRSGSTISGALLCGVDRLAATRFSFLMAIPVTAGAISLTVLKLLRSDLSQATSGVGLAPIAVGIAVAFVVGWFALRLLLRLVAQRRLHWFAVYCVAMGLFALTLSDPLPRDVPETTGSAQATTTSAQTTAARPG